MDPRIGMLAVLSTAFADGVPQVERRVDVMRIEPVWGEEELPILLLDFDDESIEERTTAAREYKHTLTISVVAYAKGREKIARMALLNIVREVGELMAEWQFILASDIDPALEGTGDFRLIEEIKAGSSINYFRSSTGNEDHLAARMAFEAVFYTRGCSAGVPRNGAPRRNVLGYFDEVATEWAERPAGISALDAYRLLSAAPFTFHDADGNVILRDNIGSEIADSILAIGEDNSVALRNDIISGSKNETMKVTDSGDVLINLDTQNGGMDEPKTHCARRPRPAGQRPGHGDNRHQQGDKRS